MDKLLEMLKLKFGNEVITEEIESDFKTHLEVAINEQVNTKIKEKETALEAKYAKEAQEFKAQFVEQTDAYMEYCAKEFLKENKVGIENEFTVSAAKSLIEAICGVLETHHFTIEPGKLAKLQKEAKNTKELEAKLNEALKKVITQEKQLFEYKKAVVVKEMTEGFSKVKVEKVLELMEGLEVADIQDFRKKLSVVIEKITDKTPVLETVDKKADTPIVEDKKSEVDKYLV